MADFEEIDTKDPSSLEQSQSGNNSKGQNVTVLLPCNVTQLTDGRTREVHVFIPDATGMAALRKPKKRQFVRDIKFTSTMTKEDVERKLCEKFEILRNQRFCCASALGSRAKLDKDNRTNLNKDNQTNLNEGNQTNLNEGNQTNLKLNFHGERRIWDGAFIKNLLKEHSALYILIEGTPESQQPTHGPANQEMIPPAGGASLAVTRPLNSSDRLAPNPMSHQKRKLDNKTAQLAGLLLQSHPASAKQKRLNFVAIQPPVDYGHFQPVLQHMSQHSSSSTAAPGTHVGSNQQVQPQIDHLATSMVQNTGIPWPVFSAGSEQSLSQAWPVFSAGSLQSPSQAIIVMERGLSTRTSLAAQGSLPQYCLPAAVHIVEHKTDPSKPVQCWQLANQEQGRTVSLESSPQLQFLPESHSNVLLQTPADPVTPATIQGSSIHSGATSLKNLEQVPLPTCTQQKVPNMLPVESTSKLLLTASDEETSDSAFDSMWEEINESDHYTGQSGDKETLSLQAGDLPVLDSGMLDDIDSLLATCQSQNQVLMTTDAHQKELTAQTTEQESLPTATTHKHFAVQNCNEEIRKRVPQQVEARSNTKARDSGIESSWEDPTSMDHDNGQSGGFIEKILPSRGYTKDTTEFVIVLREILPEGVTSCVATFGDLGNVHLNQPNPHNLTGFTPISQIPAVVQVTLVLMFANGSQKGGKTLFMYVDPSLDALRHLVNSREMLSEFFDLMSKKMKNEPSGLQTSDHSGVIEAGSLSLSENPYAWSVKVLTDLVYQAAQVGGLEFVKTIFTTSAGKVVFSSYKDSATLPEDVARANGHTTLADYLKDLNIRLAKEGSSDTGTETIDWLELKRAVDMEQGLPCTDDAQTLKNWPPPSPESDYDGSDYLADNEMSVCSSPSRGEVSDTEDEDHSQNTIIYRSFKKVNKEDLPVENDGSSLFPLHLVGNQLGVIPSIKAENAAYEHKQLNSGEVESHSSEDDMNKKEYECASFKTDQNGLNQIAVPCDNEVGNWDSLGSEEISTVKETSTGTTSSHAAAQLNISSHQETDHVELPNGSETGLDGEQKEFKKIDNGETTRSRGNSDEEALDEIKATTSDLEGLRKLREPRKGWNSEEALLDGSKAAESNLERMCLKHEERRERMTESSCEKKVDEENKTLLENDNFSEFLLHFDGNQLEVIPSFKAENAGYGHKQLDSGEVESHSSEGDMNENEFECASFKTDQNGLNQIAIPDGSATSSHTAALPSCPIRLERNPLVTRSISIGGEQKEFKKIDRSRAISNHVKLLRLPIWYPERRLDDFINEWNSDEETLNEVNVTICDLEGSRKLREHRKGWNSGEEDLDEMIKAATSDLEGLRELRKGWNLNETPCDTTVIRNVEPTFSKTIETESWREKEVNEEDNLPVENDDSSLFPWHLVANQLEFIPSMKAEKDGYMYKQLDSDEVKSHIGEDDNLTDQNELNGIAVPCGSEVENWDTLRTTSSHTAALPNISSHQETDVVAINGSEIGLDGDQKEFKMIDNDKTTRSRGNLNETPCDTTVIRNVEPTFSKTIETDQRGNVAVPVENAALFPKEKSLTERDGISDLESSKEKLDLMYRPSSSMVCTNEREFNAYLVRIADEITKKEVQEMKFLCLEPANNLPRGTLEEIKEPREFVNFLRVRGKIWHEDVGYLIWLLDTIGNVRLADMIRERVIPGSPSSPGPGKPGILPCLTPNFIGRKEDVEKIITKLQAKLRMIVIVSPPGMGKTQVAIRVSHLLKTRESLPVIYVERLDNLTDICGEILDRLSSRPCSTSVDLISHAKCKLSELEKDTVIVLDNTEDVQGKEFDDFAEWLVKSAPKAQLIITTREDVGFVSADIHKVQLEPLDANLSAELLRKLDVNCSEEQVQDLGELCGGIPLLLINCARLLKDGFNPEVLIQELRNNPIRLLKSNAKEVYDVLGRIVKLFSEDLITNLVVLSVFPSTFSSEDIEFLFEDQLQLEMVKTKMLKCTLLQKGNDQKLSLHPLLQAYCRTERDSLNMVDVGCSAQRKFNCHYLELLKSLSKKFISKNSALVAIQTLRDQKVNIIAALKNCFEDTNDTDQKGLAIDVVNSTEVLDFFARVLLPPKECAELFRKCCDITKTSGDKRRHAESLNSLGFRCLVDVACSKDELEGSRVTLQLFKEALDIRKTLPEEDQKCQTHAHTISNLGLCHVLQGNEEKGRALIKKGIKMREELGVSLYIAAGNCDLGNSYRLCGDHQTAIEIWKKNALPVFMEELGDHPWTASILNFIADSYKVLATERSEHGYAEQAEMYFRQALELRRLLGFHQDTARSHVSLSDVLVILGNSQSALDELEKALEIQKDVLGPQHKNTTDTMIHDIMIL